jgi:replicative DNA helicase
MTTPEEALRYLRAGFAPIELPRGSKNPNRGDWQKERNDEAAIARFAPDANVGVLNGEPSAGVIDVDLDALEAVAIADAFLPPTGLVFGRPSKLRSHRLYRCSPTPATTKFTTPPDPITKKSDTIIELRSTGTHTMWPPSMHPNGEIVAFDGDPKGPAIVPAETLLESIRAIATTVVLARAWPEVGVRHEVALAAAGFLLRRGLTLELVQRIIGTAASLAGDEETPGRLRDVVSTSHRLAQGGNATGGPKLAALLGDAVVGKLASWFGPDGRDDGNSVGCETESWPVPLPLDAEVVPPFPLEALPPVLADFILDQSSLTQTPPDLSALLVLGVLGASCARRVDVAIGRTHVESLNLYIMAVAESGERKGPPMRAALEPLLAIERILRKEAEPAITTAREARKLAEKRLEKLRDQAAKIEDPTERERLSAEAIQLALKLPLVPPTPTLVVSDRTVEKLELDLAQQAGAVLLASEEAGTILATVAGRHSRDGFAQFDVFLKAYDRGEIDVGRITREAVRCTTPELSIAVTPQPILLRQLRDRPEFHDRGLLPRFLFAVPRAACGHRPYNASAKASAAVRQAYAELVARLHLLPKHPDGSVLPHLVLTGDALAAWAAYHDHLEIDLREDGRLYSIREWGSKHAGRVARLAGVLHLVVSTANDPLIAVQTVGAACRLGEYFETHALAAYDHISVAPRLDAARRILSWVTRRGLKTFSARDAHQALHRRFPTMEELRPGLLHLLEYGYLRERAREERPGPGRPASPVYVVHPGIGSAANWFQNTQNPPSSEVHPGGGSAANWFQNTQNPSAGEAEGNSEYFETTSVVIPPEGVVGPEVPNGLAPVYSGGDDPDGDDAPPKPRAQVRL